MRPTHRPSLILLAIATAGCASSGARQTPVRQAEIAFPPPPATPVVRWVASIATPLDLDPGRRRTLTQVLVGETKVEERLVAPTAVAVGPDETIYVVDPQLRAVAVINMTTKRFELFGGSGSGRLAKPVGVAVAADGTLYVSDTESRAINVFDAGLNFRRAFGGPERFKKPTALALSADGRRLAVCDTVAHKVFVVDPATGRTLKTIGGAERSAKDGEFHTPVSVAFDEEGFLYVADYLNFRIQVFDPEGRPDLSFGQAGDRPGDLNRPRGVAADAVNKVIYEVDGAFQVVQMFNLDGELLMSFGSPGSGPAQFSLPSGIARGGGLLVVADTLNSRVQVFRFLGAPPDATTK